jgi:hypothetical protein
VNQEGASWLSRLGSLTSLISVITIFSAIAGVLFDLGFFTALGSGLFTLFTVSEHLLFAIQTAPVFFVFFLISVLVILVVRQMTRDSMALMHADHVFTKRLRIFILFGTGATIFILWIFLFPASIMGIPMPPLWYKIASFAITIALCFLLTRGPYIQIVTFSLLFFVGVSIFGYFYGRFALDTRTTEYQLTFKDGKELSGIVIRSGERGILFRAPSEYIMVPWDSVAFVRRRAD